MVPEHVYKSTSHIIICSASSDEHRGKIFMTDPTEVDKFAHEPTEEDHSPTVDNTVLVSESHKAEIHDENTFASITTFVFEESIQEKELERTFGERYFAGLCNPRVFAVRLLMDDVAYGPGYVIFQIQDEINRGFHPVRSGDTHVKLCLTLRSKIPQEQSCKIQEKLTRQLLCNSSAFTAHELIVSIQECVNADYSSVKSKQSSSPTGLFSFLSYINGWNVQSFDLDGALRAVQNEPFFIAKPVTNLSASISKNVDTANWVCDICYKPCDDETTGCAMKLCSHWYCMECWCDHLTSHVKDGDLQISCPGVNCNTLIDKATLLYILPYSYFLKHESYRNSAKLESSSSWKWCQGKQGRCQKIIRATSQKISSNASYSDGSHGQKLGERICVSCPCKATWCFDCGKEAHWPSTCEQAEFYLKLVKMRETGKGITTEKSFIIAADVKKMPTVYDSIRKSQWLQCCGM